MNFTGRCALLFRISFLLSTCLFVAGCATPVKSDFLTGNQPMKQGRYVAQFWAAENIPAQTFSRMYVEPVDVTRIKDADGITVSSISNFLQTTVSWQISSSN